MLLVYMCSRFIWSVCLFVVAFLYSFGFRHFRLHVFIGWNGSRNSEPKEKKKRKKTSSLMMMCAKKDLVAQQSLFLYPKRSTQFSFMEILEFMKGKTVGAGFEMCTKSFLMLKSHCLRSLSLFVWLEESTQGPSLNTQIPNNYKICAEQFAIVIIAAAVIVFAIVLCMFCHFSSSFSTLFFLLQRWIQ